MSKGEQTILVATTNPGKVRELRAMLGDAVRWASLADFPDAGEVVEDGATFAENARKKATEYAGQVKEKVSSAVDSGKHFVEEKKSLISTAIDAGKDAYSKEKEKLSKS